MFKRNSVIYRASSPYGSYKVADMTYNNRPARMLFGDNRSPQSGIALDSDPELLFEYNQRFIEIVASVQPSRVLVIGGGAFSFPAAVVDRFGGTTVDVVEIDPLLPGLAERFFNLKSHPRLNIFIQDGRKFLEDHSVEYDLIVIDAFTGMDIPRQLLSVEAAELYRSALKTGGLVAINFISAYHTAQPNLAHHMIATFESVFHGVEVYPSEYTGRVVTSDNLVLVASHGLTPELPYLQSASLPPLIGMQGEKILDP